MESLNGPSREELKYYFESSRKYFDELATYYKTADPEYYNEYIKPFYSNVISQVTKGKGSKYIGVVISIFLISIVSGLFSMLFNEQKNEPATIEQAKSYETNESSNFQLIKRQADSILSIEKRSDEPSHVRFEEELEQKLMNVDENDKNYKEAQNLLKEIKKKKRKSRSLLD